ncbi:RRP15-like protein [Rhineura floridana]|uniref:RRP15-like protein n=1 Tax=Rhineura floridana TaxID=261503 RepID=UPI002AC87B18|nr:RRP15-like protein [Rhineura floridana]
MYVFPSSTDRGEVKCSMYFLCLSRNVGCSCAVHPDRLEGGYTSSKMAAAAVGSRGEAEATGAEVEEGDSGSEWSSGIPEDSFSSGGEELDGDDEDEPQTLDTKAKDAAESRDAANAGWADAMAKVLNKKVPKSKPTILVKNKERDMEREKEKQERLEKRRQLDKKREWEMMCRVKPDVTKDRELERNLQRIATRGVVQLFNAVGKHQRNVDEKVKEAGSSERKRTKLISSVSKRDFINVLRGMEGGRMEGNATGKSLKSKQGESKSEEGPAWSILRDDFMMGASMKDWDKESDGENITGQNGIKQDSGGDSGR